MASSPTSTPTTGESGTTPGAPTDTAIPGDNTGDQSPAASLSWQESRALFASEEDNTDLTRPIIGLLAALMIAGGAVGAWYSRSGRG